MATPDIARFDALVDFLNNCGSSFSSEDTMDSGRTVATEAHLILAAIDNGHLALGDEKDGIQQAVREIVSVWNSGFEIASGEDFVTDSETVNDLFAAEFKRRENDVASPAP